MPDKSILCPTCGKEEILFSYRICKNCGKEIGSADFLKAYLPPEPMVVEDPDPVIEVPVIGKIEIEVIDKKDTTANVIPEAKPIRGISTKDITVDEVAFIDEVIEPEPVIEIPADGTPCLGQCVGCEDGVVVEELKKPETVEDIVAELKAEVDTEGE